MYIGLFAVLIVLVVLAMRYLSVNRLNKALKESNENLRETRVSKEEKETLLKEVHHRVKNNLQIITSLIRLQSGTISDPQVAAIFNESQFRIKTMALVHEELYRSDNFTSIPVREYFEKLIDGLISSYSLSGRVTFLIETDVNRLGVNTLIPLGLMANEMITNSLKHAFKGSDGHIDLSLKETAEDKYKLLISDNGPGFPSDISFESPSTLGLELIHTLANQLDGSVSFSNNPGACYTVNFACQD
jgi:two-component sensor histidine kinase